MWLRRQLHSYQQDQPNTTFIDNYVLYINRTNKAFIDNYITTSTGPNTAFIKLQKHTLSG